MSKNYCTFARQIAELNDNMPNLDATYFEQVSGDKLSPGSDELFNAQGTRVK